MKKINKGKTMKKIITSSLIALLIVSAMWLGGCYSDNIDALSTYKFQFPVPFQSMHWKRAAPDTSWDFTNLYSYKEFRDNEDRVEKAEILHFNYWLDDLIYVNLNDITDTLCFAIDTVTKERTSYRLHNIDTLALIRAANDGKNVKVNNFFRLDGNGMPIKSEHNIEFEFIRFYFVFAEYKGTKTEYDNGGKFSKNKNDWKMLDKEYLLGEFKNVNINNAFRFPDHNPEQITGDLQHHIEWVPAATAKKISEALKDKPHFFIRTEYSKVKGQTIPKYYFPWISARYDMVIRFEVEL